MSESRTSKSIKNAQVSLFFYFLQLILGFWSRKAFFDYLGSEILGLNTTAANLLGFLNLAELGIGMSVGYFLYQPLFDKDYKRLNEIVSLQGWLYKRVAYLIILGSCILFFFFPMIFAKSDLSLWYAYSTYAVLLFSSLLGYFVNYKQIVLNADQKGYKVQEYTQGVTILKTVIQIIGITYSPYPYIAWISLEIIGAITTSVILQIVLKKEYPWLHTETKDGRSLLKKYPDVIKKTKQAFLHTLSYVAASQIAPLILYGYTSLTIVALYGNYQVIAGKISSLVSSVFNSTGAAIGNLVASHDKERMLRVFWELYDSRLVITTICTLCLFHLTDSFIDIWLGEGYNLGSKFIIIFLGIEFINMSSSTVSSFINAFGLFKDVWATIVSTTLYIVLSILFGSIWGLNGVIGGIFFSRFLLFLCWKPYFLFTQGFKMSAYLYFGKVIKRYIIVILLFCVTYFLFSQIEISQTSWLSWISFAIITSAISIILTLSVFLLLFQGCRDFVMRIKHIFIK